MCLGTHRNPLSFESPVVPTYQYFLYEIDTLLSEVRYVGSFLKFFCFNYEKKKLIIAELCRSRFYILGIEGTIYICNVGMNKFQRNCKESPMR